MDGKKSPLPMDARTNAFYFIIHNRPLTLYKMHAWTLIFLSAHG